VLERGWIFLFCLSATACPTFPTPPHCACTFLTHLEEDRPLVGLPALPPAMSRRQCHWAEVLQLPLSSPPSPLPSPPGVLPGRPLRPHLLGHRREALGELVRMRCCLHTSPSALPCLSSEPHQSQTITLYETQCSGPHQAGLPSSKNLFARKQRVHEPQPYWWSLRNVQKSP